MVDTIMETQTPPPQSSHKHSDVHDTTHNGPPAVEDQLPDSGRASKDGAVNALTPPTSEDMNNKFDDGSSDLSDLSEPEEEGADDGEDIVPDHYYGGGKVPVFKPTMAQFRDFKKFVDKIDKYGMKSGIVKVVPPDEWRQSQPDLSELVKTIRIKNPIMQEFVGTHGTYTQNNIEKQRSYNLPEWKALTDEPQNQPPARRGERRRNQGKVVRGGGNVRGRASTASASATNSPKPESVLPAPPVPAVKRKPGRPRKRPLPEEIKVETSEIPPTPTSPPRQTIEKADDPTPTKKPRGRGRPPKGGQAKSVSSRRMNNTTEKVEVVDEAAFEGFDYRLDHQDEFTAERCAELETAYWKSLTFAQPMYAADMPGSLFKEECTSWNVAKLPNLLDVLGTKVPGVNTAYLYMGMWKATFAWHLEDVDLYSINYIHFGAPKQWYSISQEDARKFEKAMKTLWPNDSKACDQFLRHKTYLISPDLLQKQYGIKVNKLVHHEGEFVITYPYGYHSGYNLGYNCAESVNFATEAWLDYGRIARKCECEADSVWVDVSEIERKLRGEPTPEYYEETDDDDEDDEEVDVEEHLPSPPSSVTGKPKPQPRKRKRDVKEKDAGKKKKKRIRIKIKTATREPCILCPNDPSYEPLLPTDNGRMAHRACALYTPETWVSLENGTEKIFGVTNIDRARLELKCNYCRSKRGACFQCNSKKCTRAFHATCALPAGVQIDAGNVPTFGEDGTEYFEEGYDFRCRFHRPKRTKNVDADLLETSKLINKFAKALRPKDVVQVQYPQGDIFAGLVVENRPGEMSVLVDVLPEGDRVEVEWKWLAVLDPMDSQRPKPSASAIPMPEGMNKQSVSIENRQDGVPSTGDPFHDSEAYKWSEFVSLDLPPPNYARSVIRNKAQVKIDMERPDYLYFYLPTISTEAKSKWTDDPKGNTHVAKADFMDRVRPQAPPRQSYNAAFSANRAYTAPRPPAPPRPYVYKPKEPPASHPNMWSVDRQASFTQQQPASDATRRASYSQVPPYGMAPSNYAPLHHQNSAPSFHQDLNAPLRPFPRDAYYSDTRLPAAVPGEFSNFKEQVRRNSGLSLQRPSIESQESHQRQPSVGSAMSDGSASLSNGLGSGHAHPPQQQGGNRRPSQNSGNGVFAASPYANPRAREEIPVTKTLPQLPAPAAPLAGPQQQDVLRRSSTEWTPPSRVYQEHMPPSATYPSCPQGPSLATGSFGAVKHPYEVPRPQATYSSPDDFRAQLGAEAQRSGAVGSFGAYDRAIRDYASRSSTVFQHGHDMQQPQQQQQQQQQHSSGGGLNDPSQYQSTTTAGGAERGFIIQPYHPTGINNGGQQQQFSRPHSRGYTSYGSPKAPTPSPLSEPLDRSPNRHPWGVLPVQ